MKKKLPKISLSRETLRQLDDVHLGNAQGGGITINATNCVACSNRNTCDNYTACA
jgi:hypothetical protein